MVSDNPPWYSSQNCNRKNMHKNLALLHSFATGLGYLVETSGHKQLSSFPLLRDLKAPCHNKATGIPQQFLWEIYTINLPMWIIYKDVYSKIIKSSQHKCHHGKPESQGY